ncbi:hypothetical protein BUALT_Bualt02G0202400 [Buddleja alternifolia]|uniref:WRC domain-containing protein n=1 Tax=Buddleja alternifolia TaxID=168488 RepID=A0AAV6Y9S2_9LAMI|nr:hypothetical protein BUALT_Bualt02G0202400 [Buddleja alternifolia]
MRIRKHAKISALLYATSSSTIPEPHVCQLNQSPWDVMSFSPPLTPPPPPPPSQVYSDCVYAGNGSSNQSISVVQREFEVGRQWEYSGGIAAPNKAEQPKSGGIILCSKTDGKSWQCRREAAKGNSLCEHHLSLLKNYTNNLANSTIKKPEKPVVFRPRPKRASTSASSNPHQFYYYSGFGPRWGKKRGENSKNNGSGMPKSVEHEHELDPLILSRIIDKDFDYDQDEDEEEENRENTKKRARKPIKARSLKSLM